MSEPAPLAGALPPPPPGRPAAVGMAAVAAAAFLFGTTFIVMQDAVEEVEPVPFLAVRFLIGAAVLAPFAARRPARQAGLLRAGVLAGLVLAGGYVFQTVGLQYTSSSVAAFITYLLVVIVPVMAAVVHRHVPPAVTVVGIAVAVGGLALLTGGSVGLGKGEVLTIGCAIAFAGHIVLLSDYAPRFEVTRLNFAQIATVGLVLAVPGLFLGGYDFTAAAWAAAAYCGVAVTAGAFALQVSGQRTLGATRTAVVLLLEPVFAAVLGYATGERLGAAGTIGALLILVGVLISEVPGLLTQRSTSRQPDRYG